MKLSPDAIFEFEFQKFWIRTNKFLNLLFIWYFSSLKILDAFKKSKKSFMHEGSWTGMRFFFWWWRRYYCLLDSDHCFDNNMLKIHFADKSENRNGMKYMFILWPITEWAELSELSMLYLKMKIYYFLVGLMSSMTKSIK